MGNNYKYFVIPFSEVPRVPTYTVWYATWSTERPVAALGATPPLVVGVIEGDLPHGAVLLADAIKDPKPPPPPPPFTSDSLSDYQNSVNAWVSLGRDA